MLCADLVSPITVGSQHPEIPCPADWNLLHPRLSLYPPGQSSANGVPRRIWAEMALAFFVSEPPQLEPEGISVTNAASRRNSLRSVVCRTNRSDLWGQPAF
jgi:hypothetical protein